MSTSHSFHMDVHIFLRDESLLLLVIFFLLNFCLNILLAVNRFFGFKNTLQILFNKYSKPKVDHKFLMILDVNNSTEINAALGDKRYSEFLQDFYKDVCSAVEETSGEIYEYVGDEIVATWSLSNEDKIRQAYKTAQLIQQSVENRKDYYLKTFQHFPAFKSIYHYGEVVIYAMGITRILVMYRGNILNEASRMLQTTKQHSRQYLASQAAYQLLPIQSIPHHSLGEFKLRGIKKRMAIYSINFDQ